MKKNIKEYEDYGFSAPPAFVITTKSGRKRVFDDKEILFRSIRDVIEIWHKQESF